MEHDEFFQRAKEPDFPDQMVFQLRATNPANQGTFTREGISGIVDLIDGYLMARIFGRWTATGRPPKEMRIVVNVSWHAEDESLLQFGPPWFSGELDSDGMSQADGTSRLPRP